MENMKTIRELVKEHPSLWLYDYSDKSSKEYKDLQGLLSDWGYALAEEDKQYVGEYSDIKAYLDCNIIKVDTLKQYECAHCSSASSVEEWVAKTRMDYGYNVPTLTEVMVRGKKNYCYICPNCGETCYLDDEEIIIP